MASKKPKNATAGKRIAKWTHSWAGFWFKTNTFDAKLSGRIDRAIARAVRKERERCVNIGKLWVASEVHDADMVRALANGDVL